MPLPQKVIDRLSREPAGTPGWSGQLLLFSGALFSITFIVYGGIVFGYKPHFEGRVKKLDAQIRTFTQQIPLKEQETLTAFYAQLTNIKTLLDRHVSLAPFWEWLEKHTHANVYYRQLSVDPVAGRVNFSAAGRSLGDVEEQLAVFERAKEVEEIMFQSVSVGEKGVWGFGGALLLSADLFKSTPTP
jgi:hypothetical protein